MSHKHFQDQIDLVNNDPNIPPKFKRLFQNAASTLYHSAVMIDNTTKHMKNDTLGPFSDINNLNFKRLD